MNQIIVQPSGSNPVSNIVTIGFDPFGLPNSIYYFFTLPLFSETRMLKISHNYSFDTEIKTKLQIKF